MAIRERKKGAVYILFLAIVLIGLVLAAGTEQSNSRLSKIKNTEDLSALLRSMGWECDPAQLTEQETALPQQFDDTFIAYNAIQLQQGFDLTKYAGKLVTVYTVPLTNYPNTSDAVLATVIVYKGKVIGGDIHAAAMDGFMHGLTKAQT